MNERGGVDGNVQLLAQTAQGLNMVSMVVGDKYATKFFYVDAGLFKVFLNGSGCDAGINQHAAALSTQVEAVAAASTA